MTNPFGYDRSPKQIEEPILKPSYDQFLKWGRAAESKSIAYDIWARGNYVRYVSSIETNVKDTVVIPFKYIDELRCYYRRIALMGLSAHFVYTGELGAPQKCLCLHPADNYVIDAGRGWIAASGSQIRSKGQNWFPVIGYSRPLPEIFVEWLTTEASDSFRRGEVFISPAELNGIHKNFIENGIEDFAGNTNSSPIFSPMTSGEFLFQLDIPYIDQLDHNTFVRILEDHDHRLLRFRMALKKLIKNEGYDQIQEIVDELKDEIAQLRLSDNGIQFRQTISKFGGVLTTFGAGIAALGVALARGPLSPDIVVPTLTGILGAGTINTAIDVYKQSVDRKAKRGENKYSIFWDLGIRAPSDLKRAKTILKYKKHNQILPSGPEDNFDCHWLCDPGPLEFLRVRRVNS